MSSRNSSTVEDPRIRAHRGAESPRVSIVIPIYNEERRIAQCLDSVVAQTYRKDRLEVLLVDGGSRDRTREIIDGYCARFPFLRLLENPRRIAPAALNIGIRAATGDVVVRLDAHTRYDPDYVAKCVETLATVGAANVGGPITTLPGDDTPTAQAIALATSHPFGVGNSKFRTSREAQFVDTVPFGAFRREVFAKVGLFNEALVRNQDIELNVRIRRSGGTIYLNPEIRSYYYNQATLRGLARQSFSNGEWNVYTHALSGTRLAPRHYAPLAFVTALGIALGAVLTPLGMAPLGLIACPYLACCAYASIRLSRGRLRLLPILPLAFLTLHLAYGTGSLVGLLRVRQVRRGRALAR